MARYQLPRFLILLTSVATVHVSADAAVIGDGPGNYQTPDVKALGELNGLYEKGKISFAEYQARLVQLEKRVTSAAVAPPPPPVTSPSAAPVQTASLGPITYSRFGSNLTFKIDDTNVPLSQEGRSQLLLTLSHVPTSHLEGIKQLRFGQVARPDLIHTGLTSEGHVVVFPENASDRPQATFNGALLATIGGHVYDQLSDAEKKAFDYPGSRYNGKLGFQALYEEWTTKSEHALETAVTQAKDGKPQKLAQVLQIASLFAAKNFQSPQIQAYSMDANGKITRSLIDGSFSTNPATNEKYLIVGDWSITLKDGKLISLGKMSPKIPSSIDPVTGMRVEHMRHALLQNLPIPVDLPAQTLAKFGEVK